MSTELDAAVTLRYDLTRAIRETLGLPENVAVPMADHLARGLARRIGGLYIGKRELNAERDEAIRRDWNGRNLDEIQQKYGVSRPTVYRVLGKKSYNRAKVRQPAG